MQQNQVVITLTLEQFARLQQLAKMAGAESVNVFAKEKLLAILGATTPLVINSAEAKSSSLQPLVSELKRMHIELKELVTESLEKQAQAIPVNSSTADETREVNQEDSNSLNQKGFHLPFLDNLSANQNSSGLNDPLQELLGPDDSSDTPKPAGKNKGLSEQDALLNTEEDFLADIANIEFDEDDAFAVPPITKKEQLDELNTIKEALAKEDKPNKKSSRQNIYQPTIANTPDAMPDSKDNNSSLSNKESTTSDRKGTTSNSKKQKAPSTDSSLSTSKGPPPKKRS